MNIFFLCLAVRFSGTNCDNCK